MELFRLRTPDGGHQVELLLEQKHSEALSKILLKAHSSSTDLRRELVSFFSSLVPKDEGRYEKENVVTQATKRHPKK